MLPLAGVEVVSLAVNLPGPLAAARLAELGATVTKVEPPTGDPLAAAAPDWYRALVSTQTVVTLDVKAAADRAKLDDLLATADLLVTSMRPSALAKLGLAQPQQRFPELSLIEIVGHADDPEVPGHDLNYQAVHATLTPPRMPTVPAADILGAERAVSTALAALVARASTGVGRPYRVALEEAAARAGDAVRYRLMGPNAVLGGAFPGYGIYECRDGFVALGAVEPHFFMNALSVFDADGSHDGFRNAFADKTIAELEAIAAANDLPLNGVRTPATGK
ncbi:CoA transferase [Nocardia seriolae]|uniref:2-octaprenyl-3-methyl-6-methoxy-1,4-benzoquinol hydroxylase n=1 Tax=Nocardia seriolae TaxID=37332 RepID=A0A0B8NAR8_9NOCA|nr:CoA transferase [Nocardia seriolae]APA98681.1 Formyl-CoA transferase [Nocardia seriolae]MTJ63757.1 CoA transferase [Nocardia seriolae]MTJ74016.1 CoA transferase [Nocardia seriolae]MTJ88321.1 CoA transferase [Nocardia seriolae]MTK32307.1 CoA transferase [Nocardia seriolae]